MIKDKQLAEIIMVQPNTSLTGSFVRMLPIGLLYASAKVVKNGFPVHVFDARIRPSSWERDLECKINENTAIIGITVMSGVSIMESLKISRFVKFKYPKIRVVWGGPHVTSSPDDGMQEKAIDFIIRGYGSDSFYQLVLNITGSPAAIPFVDIKGLSWRDENDNVQKNELSNEFEFINYREIPYHLVQNLDDYRHIDSNETAFPLYSVMGCPYSCAFCSSPALYSRFSKKWHPYPVKEVVEHIKMLKDRYGATFIYFIDDDSFVDLTNIENIIDGIKQYGIEVKLAFRGARINEISKMTDSFLEKLVDAGTNTMHIGAESGSNRLLKLLKKNITVEETIEANKKLARHTRIQVFYNFIVGFPTETIEETKMTRDLILRLIKDNPSCCVIPLNKPRPLPGTGLYDMAVNHGYVAPSTLEEWGRYDVESSDYNPVWLSKQHNAFIRMMFLCMYFIDDKIFKLSTGRNLKYKVLRLLARMYKPVAMFRFKYGIVQLLIEDKIYSFLKKFI